MGAMQPAGESAKPPGSTLCGSMLELGLALEQPIDSPGQFLGASEARGGRRLPATAEEVVGWMEQLLGMLRVLAPPVRLLLRLSGVLLQASESGWPCMNVGPAWQVAECSQACLRPHNCFWTTDHAALRVGAAGPKRQPAARQRQPAHGLGTECWPGAAGPPAARCWRGRSPPAQQQRSAARGGPGKEAPAQEHACTSAWIHC
jgi:hypothetical protein